MAEKKTTSFSEEQIEAIENYGDRIQTLESIVEAIRKRPGMYGGGIGDSGFLTLIREVFQNAIDQIIDPSSPANFCSLIYDMRTLTVKVADNGLGFPFHDMVRMVTEMHTSKNFDKKRKGEYSSGLHGAGLKVVNALSSYCKVESFKYDGTAMCIEFNEGILEKGPYKIPNKGKEQGSAVTFVPCLDILGVLALDWKDVYTLVKRILSLTPIGSTAIFTAIDLDGVEHNETIINKDGILTEFITSVQYPMGKPIVISEDNGEQKLDVAFMYDAGGEDGPNPIEKVTAFCNMCPTVKGHHITGVVEGICRWFTDYMNNIFLAQKKGKTKVTAADIKCGLNIMISAACLEPIFIGQAKEQLSNQEMRKFCADVVVKGLGEWSKQNPGQLQKFAEYFKGIAEVRTRSEASKSKIASSYTANVLNGLPRNFVAPTKSNEEFFIVEGDSAKCSAENGRDVKTQGIYPIRGKISSAYKKSKEAFWDNTEVVGISRIILGGKNYWRTFDPYKDVEWKRIIFLTDADVDGAHIATLLLRYMVRYMPQLIEAGKVFKAMPPLYANNKDGKNFQYYVDAADFVRYIQKNFIKNNTVQFPDGKQLSGKDMTVFFMINEEYKYYLETCAQIFGVDPYLLEFALMQYISNTPMSRISKDLKKKYRFMGVEKMNDSILYDGTIKESNFLPMDQRLLSECKPILDIMRRNVSMEYVLNGEPVTTYDIMQAFEKSKPNGISRYKGLGEMTADKLGESTLLPSPHRTLIQYTFEDAKEEIEAIREFESDTSKLLQFVGNVRRVDLVE